MGDVGLMAYRRPSINGVKNTFSNSIWFSEMLSREQLLKVVAKTRSKHAHTDKDWFWSCLFRVILHNHDLVGESASFRSLYLEQFYKKRSYLTKTTSYQDHKINQQYLVLGNPFGDPELLESMRHQWQQLPNCKYATVEGLTWEGRAEENAGKYTDLVGVSTHQLINNKKCTGQVNFFL